MQRRDLLLTAAAALSGAIWRYQIAKLGQRGAALHAGAAMRSRQGSSLPLSQAPTPAPSDSRQFDP